MKNWLFTPSFCKAAMLRDLMEHIHRSPKDLEGMTHVVIDNHYPVNKEKNREEIRSIAHQYGAIYVDSGFDRGLHDGINNAMKFVGVTPEDTFIGCDPDDRPSPGWTEALLAVRKADPKIAVLALNFWVIDMRKKQHGLPVKSVAGHNVIYHPSVECWNVAAFDLKLIFESGGFREPNKYYGGLELALQEAWRKKGQCLAYLEHIRSDAAVVDRNDPRVYDADYGTWKLDHATKGFTESFETWLKQRGKA